MAILTHVLLQDFESLLEVEKRAADKYSRVGTEAYSAAEYHARKTITTILLLTVLQPWIYTSPAIGAESFYLQNFFGICIANQE